MRARTRDTSHPGRLLPATLGARTHPFALGHPKVCAPNIEAGITKGPMVFHHAGLAVHARPGLTSLTK